MAELLAIVELCAVRVAGVVDAAAASLLALPLLAELRQIVELANVSVPLLQMPPP